MRHKFSKVLYIVALFSKCTRALTFQNVCQARDRGREGARGTRASRSQPYQGGAIRSPMLPGMGNEEVEEEREGNRRSRDESSHAGGGDAGGGGFRAKPAGAFGAATGASFGGSMRAACGAPQTGGFGGGFGGGGFGAGTNSEKSHL